MLAINTLKFYNSIKEQLYKIDKTIIFMKENCPTDEQKSITSKLLSSDISLNGSFYIYAIKKEDASNSEKLKRNYMDKFSNFKKEFSALEFFGIISSIKLSISKLFEEYNYYDESITLLLEDLEQLANAYDTVIRSNDDKEKIVSFFNKMELFISEYLITIKSLDNYINILSSSDNFESTNRTNIMEIQLLDIEYNLNEFGNLLIKLDNAYNSISSIVVNKITFKSTKIIKIESGSLLSRILGDENILEVIAIMLKRLSDYIHTSFTKQGKIELNSMIMKQISEDADIINKLEKLGINTDESKLNVEGALNSTTKELFEIVSSAPKIKINDEQIDIANPTTYLDYRTKQLGNKKSNKKKRK